MKNIIDKKVSEIREILKSANAKGIVLGLSGGKDSVLVGILCKLACPNVLGVMMPCETAQNYGQDLTDAKAFADEYAIESITVDLTETKKTLLQSMNSQISASANANIAPRIRMTALYALAQSKGYLVAGTGNKSESFMGYFTKWGDGAYDFNPISDLTVTEVYSLLEFLNAPKSVIEKPPSAGLYEGQTDEKEMGVTYKEIDAYIEGKPVDERARQIIQKAHRLSQHKRKL